MQRLLGFIFILLLFSALTTSVQAIQAAPECESQEECGDGFACDMEINECIPDDDSGSREPPDCIGMCDEGFDCDWETGKCVEDEGEEPPTFCWSDDDCMDGYWCSFASLVGGDSGAPASEAPDGEREAPEPAEETGDEGPDAEPAEETGDEAGAPTQDEPGYCMPIDDETGGGDEVGAETTGGEETGGEETGGEETGDTSDEGGSSGSGGCSVSSPSDVDRGLVLLLALAAAFALLFPRAERRGRSL